jgi:hypothetical protein
MQQGIIHEPGDQTVIQNIALIRVVFGRNGDAVFLCIIFPKSITGNPDVTLLITRQIVNKWFENFLLILQTG